MTESMFETTLQYYILNPDEIAPEDKNTFEALVTLADIAGIEYC
jgi:hypothetical protein